MVIRSRLKRTGAGANKKSRLKRIEKSIKIEENSILNVVSMDKARTPLDDTPYPPRIGVEAEEFLKKNKSKFSFASNHFSEKEDALKLVKELKATGAKVIIAGIRSENWRFKEEGDVYADILYITNGTPQTVMIMAKSKPDEIDEVSKGVYRLWWD